MAAAFDLTREDEVRPRFGAGLAAAIVLHVAAFIALGMAIEFRAPADEVRESEIVVFAPIAPPPPDTSDLGPTDVTLAAPRFRPRMPSNVDPTRQRQWGDPALAIWKYLCNRDGALSEAARAACPTFNLGDVGLDALGPLNRRGDVGALFGADTTTMSLDEVGVARGWLETPPVKGQSGLVGRTDTSPFDPLVRQGPMPWEEGPTKGTSYNWKKGRNEVVTDLR